MVSMDQWEAADWWTLDEWAKLGKAQRKHHVCTLNDRKYIQLHQGNEN